MELALEITLMSDPNVFEELRNNQGCKFIADF
jgi:hypothetical protein